MIADLNNEQSEPMQLHDVLLMLKIFLCYIIGQSVLLFGEFVPDHLQVILGSSYQVIDTVIIYLTHLLSLITFMIGIIIGTPKAWKILRNAFGTVKRKVKK